MFAWYRDCESLLAQIQLVLFMLGMGANLTVGEFLHIFRRPKSFLLGAVGQILVIPFLALAVNHLFGLEGGLAVGLILVSAMPGGALSKVITYFGKGNVPLSITLSVFSTLAALVFVPLWLNLLAAEYVPPGFSVPAEKVVVDVALFLILPLAVGMFAGRRMGRYRHPFARICVRLGIAFVVVMIAGSLGSGRIKPDAHGILVPLAIIVFCVAGMQVNQVPFWLLKLPRADRMAAGIEVTMRNINLALLIHAKFFAQDETLDGGVFFVTLFYAATALVAGLLLAGRHRLLARGER
jgi:BASS family bile acid:Na+ symporter